MRPSPGSQTKHCLVCSAASHSLVKSLVPLWRRLADKQHSLRPPAGLGESTSDSPDLAKAWTALRRQRRLYIGGPAGSGKTVTLAALVDWARLQNWLVRPAASWVHASCYCRVLLCLSQERGVGCLAIILPAEGEMGLALHALIPLHGWHQCL